MHNSVKFQDVQTNVHTLSIFAYKSTGTAEMAPYTTLQTHGALTLI